MAEKKSISHKDSQKLTIHKVVVVSESWKQKFEFVGAKYHGLDWLKTFPVLEKTTSSASYFLKPLAGGVAGKVTSFVCP